MRRFLFVSVLHSASELRKLQHEILLAVVHRRQKLRVLHCSALFSVTVQDGFDPDNGIKNIRTCISLERSKAVDIENIILGGLIGQVAVLNGGKTHDLRRLFRVLISYASVLHDLAVHFFVDVRDQCFQTHNAALSRLEGLAIFAVHGSESQEGKLRILFHQTSLPRAAEYLDEMELLALIHHIEDLVRMIKLHPLYNSGEVRSRVQGSPV